MSSSIRQVASENEKSSGQGASQLNFKISQGKTYLWWLGKGSAENRISNLVSLISKGSPHVDSTDLHVIAFHLPLQLLQSLLNHDLTFRGSIAAAADE